MNVALPEVPRNKEAIKAIPPFQRYRYAMHIGAIPSEQDAVAVFSGYSLDQQADMILQKLVEADAVSASGGQVAAPPAAVPPPMAPVPQIQAQPAPPPGMAAPAMMMPTPIASPPMAPAMAPPGMSPPGMSPPGMAAPAPMPAPVPQAASVVRSPVTSANPAPAPAAPVPAMQGQAQQLSGVSPIVIQKLGERIGEVQKILEEEVPGMTEHEDVMALLAKIDKGQQTLLAMGLMILENVMQPMGRSTIIQAINEEVERHAHVALYLKQQEDKNQGKG